jgi:hypothetical protein
MIAAVKANPPKGSEGYRRESWPLGHALPKWLACRSCPAIGPDICAMFQAQRGRFNDILVGLMRGFRYTRSTAPRTRHTCDQLSEILYCTVPLGAMARRRIERWSTCEHVSSFPPTYTVRRFAPGTHAYSRPTLTFTLLLTRDTASLRCSPSSMQLPTTGRKPNI